MRRVRVLVAAAAALAATACGASPGGDDGRLAVVAGFYPLQFVAEAVGGDRVSVTNLAPPGAEPHDLELKPSQVGAVAGADLVVYLPGFQPELDAVVEQDAADAAFDAGSAAPLLGGDDDGDEHGEGDGHGDGHDHSGPDPHFWLDPTRLAAVGDQLAQRLTDLDPPGGDGYRERAAALRTTLEALDRAYAQRLRTCERREIVVSHDAFGYLAHRYDLEQIAVSGLTPEGEPTPRQIADVIALARDHRATTIFFETLVSPDVAETIAAAVGARTEVLDPIEGPPQAAGDDYVSVMHANLDALATALGCA